MSNENAKIDDNYKKSLTAVSDDALREIKKLLVDPITGRLKVQITGANKSKKQEVYNETGGTLSQNRFVKVVSDNNLYLIPNVDYISSLNDIPVGFLTVDFLNGSRAEPLIRGRVEIAGFDTSTANIGDPVYSDENGNPTLFPTGLEVGQVLTPATDGVVFINLGAKTDIVEKMTTATDPAIDAAVTQTIVDNFIGVIITLTTTGNSQTIASPTLTSKIGKKFTVVNNDTSTNSIVVNGQTIEIGEATTFIWDGSAWIYVDINENLFEIAGSIIRPITDGNDLDMRTGTITTPTLYANTILEKTTDAGVTIDGLLIKDSQIYIDIINEKTTDAGVTIDGVLIKDGTIAKTVVGLGNVDNIQQMPLSYLDTDGNLTANSDVKVSSQKATKTYVDSAVAGLWDYRGSYDASGNTYPTTGGSGTSGAILKGDLWAISVAGTLGGKAIQVGDFIIAKIDTPEQTSTNWDSLNTNLTYVPEDVANKVISISALSTDTEYASAKCIFDELALKQNVLSKATGSDIDTGTDNDKYVTSKSIADSKLSFTDGVETLNNKTIDLDDNTILNAGKILVGENLLDNSNFINVSTYGYGTSVPDGNNTTNWENPNSLSVQGGFPEMTKQQVLDLLEITDSELEGLWNLNEASGDAIDLSSNNLTLSNSAFPVVQNYLMQYSRKSTVNNQYLYTNTVTNLLPSTGLLWGLNFKYGQLNKDGELIGLDNGATTHSLSVVSNKVVFKLNGLSATLTSDITLEEGKSYFIVAGYSSNTLYLFINGILKTLSVTGSIDNIGLIRFTVGAGLTSGTCFGTYQNVFVTSAFRPISYMKNLWYKLGYKGIKTERNTTISALDGTNYIDLPQDMVMRLRGKSLTLCADVYSLVANTSFIQIVNLPNLSGAITENTSINAYERLSVTKLIDTNATTIRIIIGTVTSNTSSWFKNLMLVEGETPVTFWNASQDDWARFPRLMRMDPPQYKNAYSFEENRWYDFIPKISSSASMTILASSNANGKAMIIGKNGYVQAGILQSKGGTATTYGIDIEIPLIFNNVSNTPYGYASIDNMFGQVGLYGYGNITGKSDKLQIRSSTNMITDVSQRWAYIGATALPMD